MQKRKAGKVVLVGRPNVGKSTLFNRLLGKRRALVHDLPGVTRDRLEARATWILGGAPVEITLIDTGGLAGERFSPEIREQVMLALEDADVILFLMDSQVGLHPLDQDLYKDMVRAGITRSKDVIGVVNKIDETQHESRLSDFFELGLDPLIGVSAEHARGTEELQEVIGEKLRARSKIFAEAPSLEEPMPAIAIVGRPNVGKSTLVNAILGQNRMITSPIAGTTVDAVDSLTLINGQPYRLVDTAGIRRKSKTEQGVEVLAVVQARKAIERADIAVLVLDGEHGIAEQDAKIGGLIEDSGRAVVLLMNKWDVHRGNRRFTPQVAAECIRKEIKFLKYAPLVFASALYGEGLGRLGDLFEEMIRQRHVRIPTHELTEWVRQEATVHNPKNAKFFVCNQVGKNPPSFVCHVNDPDKIHFSLKRHLVNGMRQRWGFMGSPVRLRFLS